MSKSIRDRMLNWKKNRNNPYYVLKLAAKKGGKITYTDLSKEINQVKDPRAALISMTTGSSYPRLFKKVGKDTYEILPNIMKLIRELYLD